MDLSGRIALVTGASRGIGAAIARRLAEVGADVAVGYASNRTAAEEQTACISGMGRRAVAVGSDVSDPVAIEEMTGIVEAELGSVDILISNAGIAPQQSLEEITVEDWDRVMAVNLRPAFLLAKRLAPGVRGGRAGRRCRAMRSRVGYSPDVFRLGGWVVPRRSPKPSWRSSPIRLSRLRLSRWTAGCTHVSVVAGQAGERGLSKLA